ncbi:MAG: amino acid adenylation domain-containing protein, partial [Bacteroidota bacterium]
TDGDSSLSYRELYERSNMLAHQLGRVGSLNGDAVGLYCGRTVDLLVGILGIQRAGGAYVPLDPEYPRERIDFILADAGAEIVVHAADLTPPGADHVFVGIPRAGDPDLLPNLNPVRPEQTAYIIYTSGSTGKPKGIPISHANLAHSTAARFRFYDTELGAFLLLSSFSFDSSVAGIFWSLAAGGKLVLSARRAEQDPASLGRLVRAEGVTHTLLLPSLYQLILEFAAPEDLASLRTVMVAGEACPPGLVDRHFGRLPDTELVNEYGPTEGTVWSTAHRIVPADARSVVPIGRPVHGVGHYVLDRYLQPVPVGVAGELHLSGPGLAKGYVNRPELTRERFFTGVAAGAEVRLYKTGDLVRYRKDGKIDFLGRGDAQVKIRGFRVELSGIGNALNALDGVRESVVRVHEINGDARLVAYYVPQDDTTDAAALAAQLRRSLPDYMVPSVFLRLEHFPRLPNGKVDLRALPTPTEADTQLTRPGVQRSYASPETDAERTLAAIWTEVLGHDPVSRHDDFFAIGGDSLKSIRVIALAKKKGLALAPHQLFNHPTLAELAAAISVEAVTDERDASAYETLVLLRKGGDQAPLFCVHSGGGHVFFYRALADGLNGDRPVYALQPPGLMGQEQVQDSIEAMAADYVKAIREVRPQGPYHLLGTCFSNAVCVEMAHQLRAAGARVGEIFIVDSGTGTFLRPDADLAGKNPLDSLLRLVRGGHWDKLLRRVRDRYILRKRSIEGRFDEQKKNLYGTIGALNTIYDAYEWKPVAGRVNLLRSSEFAGRTDKDHHVRRWTALSAAPPVVRVVEGEHQTIFEPPAVTGLAQAIDVCFAPAST